MDQDPEFFSMRNELPEWFETMFDRLVLRGFVEPISISQDGEWLYGISEEGKKFLYTYMLDPQAFDEN